jgi:hypothetical protein
MLSFHTRDMCGSSTCIVFHFYRERPSLKLPYELLTDSISRLDYAKAYVSMQKPSLDFRRWIHYPTQHC